MLLHILEGFIQDFNTDYLMKGTYMSYKAYGTLIINGFLHSPQTDTTYKWIADSAERHNIDLDVKTNCDYPVFLDSFELKKAPEKSDFILYWNKDIILGRALEKAGLRLFNPIEGIRLCDSKALTTIALSNSLKMPRTINIPMTFDTIGYNDFTFIDSIEEEFSYPFVIKECFGSYGGQVYLADSKDKAVEILKSVDARDCIAQEYIKSSFGRDIRAYVVGGKIAAAMERRNDHDFRANITNGGSSYPYTLSKEQENMALKAASLLNLDFAGVDLMFGKDDEPLLCEVNSNAQFIGLYEASKINIPDMIFDHILNTIG